MNTERETGLTRVWDPVVRIFHWTLVLAFFTAYLTEDDLMTPHVYAGYLIAALLTVRIIWGLIGTRHARFRDFIFSPEKITAYLKQMLRGKEPRYLGHNPAGGVMVILLVTALVITTLTGVALYGTTDLAGPMAGVFQGDYSADILEEIHEFFSGFTLFLVGLHVAGVLFASFSHRENLAKSMLTGNKKQETLS